MESLGATMIRFELGEYDTLAPVVATSQFEARTVMERYFSSLVHRFHETDHMWGIHNFRRGF